MNPLTIIKQRYLVWKLMFVLSSPVYAWYNMTIVTIKSKIRNTIIEFKCYYKARTNNRKDPRSYGYNLFMRYMQYRLYLSKARKHNLYRTVSVKTAAFADTFDVPQYKMRTLVDNMIERY